jgi:hypothetical protein
MTRHAAYAMMQRVNHEDYQMGYVLQPTYESTELALAVLGLGLCAMAHRRTP